MSKILHVPISSVIALTSERLVELSRAILRSECCYAYLDPRALTISSGLTVPDGGVDAEVNVPKGISLPKDCFIPNGLTGFQIKAGISFKPWQESAMQGELLNSKGNLGAEVQHILKQGGNYILLCSGHDLTPEQRNKSRKHILNIISNLGFHNYKGHIDILGASQIADVTECYPGPASLLTTDPIQEAWVLDEWRLDSHMTNSFEESQDQLAIIHQIRTGLLGQSKHIRILGEPGLGKTRMVLEAVEDEFIAPYVLYIQHGTQFGQSKLFRQLLKNGFDRPLVLVIDELPESEMSDIWRHLKPRCGNLKVVSMDHGRDETHDDEIVRLYAPRLSDETIKNILITQVGEPLGLDRWVNICEGSPRTAQAVAENLRANPNDILKPPSTVPIWERFVHGYERLDESFAVQVDCVTQYLSLFSRFGYETPVGNEAQYIFELIRKADPTIGWARFQEIIHRLRSRRVLQGSRTLFYVPRALHIYLWKKFWVRYGRGFDFSQTFRDMPESLHVWFLSMFKYAEDTESIHVIEEILKPDGLYSKPEMLKSSKGSEFLSTLAEANPEAVLKLLEFTVGKWADQELLNFSEHRQNIVWALEKIAVWSAFTERAINLLVRLAINENATYSNNSAGTLIGLFSIGPEAAATESTPEARLPPLLKLLRSNSGAERRLGLEIMKSALDCNTGYRTVGPEYQGLKDRAKLWIPATYDDWGHALFTYFRHLVDETRDWPQEMRAEVCLGLLDAVDNQINIKPCTELAFEVLNILVDDPEIPADRLNSFFWHWLEYKTDARSPDIESRVRNLARQYSTRDLASRFQRYVLDVEWIEWDDDLRERQGKSRNRSKTLVNALARRIALCPNKLDEIQHLLVPKKQAIALRYFGEQLAHNDNGYELLQRLVELTVQSNHLTCLDGYLSVVRKNDPDKFHSMIEGFLESKETAWLGVSLTLYSEYDDGLFLICMDAFDKKWVEPSLFGALRFGRAIESIPRERTGALFHKLKERDDQISQSLLIEFLDSISFDDSLPISPEFVYEVVSKIIPGEDTKNEMSGYHWKNVCLKLIKWDANYALPLLDCLLTKMGEVYRLSYDSNVEPLANQLVKSNPSGAWQIVRNHFEICLPKWRSDLYSWLKGGFSAFDQDNNVAAIVDLPVSEIIEWIEIDPVSRAGLIAHTTLATLDDESGGLLTRELLHKYGNIDGVVGGISATFHSGSYSGLTSVHLKGKRDKLRKWLASGFKAGVVQWIESEIKQLDRQIEHEETYEERDRFT